ncbi:DUF3836 domain-containing protein [Bacteroides sp. 51]|uniref:DUF3836 domain-containing protein n=1 Tax=Bacteroides sp. 51 TaxID=2302938 RepID=UPI0013D6F663|nr:DUF3836 domain-containing protein [Bacteroides sp. 51]NDV82098.1 DUF3836 domain-containing protein [Bacteroides sp. 51]
MSITNIFTATILSTMLLTSSLASGKQKFAYNVETGKNKEVTSQTVYKVDRSGKYLYHHLKYNFNFDEQNRPSEKEVLKWDEEKQTWEKAFRLTYQYNLLEYSIKLAFWDSKANAYKDTSEKAVYSFNNIQNYASYESYKLNEQTQEWNLVVNHAIIESDGKLLVNK